MEDVVASLKEASAGMTSDEISAALTACPTVPPEKVATLTAWIVSLNAA